MWGAGGAVGEALPDGAALALRLRDPRLAKRGLGADPLAPDVQAPASRAASSLTVEDPSSAPATVGGGDAAGGLARQRQRRRGRAGPGAPVLLPTYGALRA